MNILPTALAGLDAAEARMEKTARAVAHAEFREDGADEVNLSAEMVALIDARNAAAVNVKVIQTEEEMQAAVTRGL